LCRSRDLEEEVKQQRAKMEALENQLHLLGHAPCTVREGKGEEAGSKSAARRYDENSRETGSAGLLPKIPKIREGGGARAEAASIAAASLAAALDAPTESVIGKLARLSVPNLKRRVDGTWGEGEEGSSAKRLRTTGGGGGGA